MGEGCRVSALIWTLMIGAVGLFGTVETVVLDARRSLGGAAFAYAAGWVAVWLLAEHRIRRPAALPAR